MKLNKKGVIWPYLMAAIIALVVVVLVIMWFNRSGGTAFGEIEGKLEGLGDCDKDGAADMFDKCPCDDGKTELKEGEVCGSASAEATKNCPDECK